MRISDWSSDVCSADLLPAVEPQYQASLAAALAETGQQIEAIEASPRSLQRYERESGKIAEPLAAVLPPEAQGTLAEMVAARRTAIEQELVAAEMQALADAPVAGASIGRTEKTAGGSLKRLLSPDRKSVVCGKRVSVRVDLGGGRRNKK